MYPFLDAWVIPYEVPSYLYFDNAAPFVSGLISNLYTHLGTETIKTTAHRSNTSTQVERNNETILVHLFYYVATHEHKWNLFAQPFIYTKNTSLLVYQHYTSSWLSECTHLAQSFLTIHQPLQRMCIMQQTRRLYNRNCSHAWKHFERASTNALIRRRIDLSGTMATIFIPLWRLIWPNWQSSTIHAFRRHSQDIRYEHVQQAQAQGNEIVCHCQCSIIYANHWWGQYPQHGVDWLRKTSDRPKSSSQSFATLTNQRKPSYGNDISRQTFQTVASEYEVDQIVLHNVSIDDLFPLSSLVQASIWKWLYKKPVTHLRQHFIDCYRKRKSQSNKRRKKCFHKPQLLTSIVLNPTSSWVLHTAWHFSHTLQS